MPIRPTENPEIPNMRGLNLFHYSYSNCSMRIRLFLDEKEIPWNDHFIDLRAQKNLTEEYFAIHPQGSFQRWSTMGSSSTSPPIFSNIWKRNFPSRRLPRTQLRAVPSWIRCSSSPVPHFPVIKTWAYGRNNKPTKTPESMHKLEVLQKDNKWIVDFHKETMAEGGIAEEKILAAEKILKSMFADSTTGCPGTNGSGRSDDAG